MKSPAFQFYPGDYLSSPDVMLMSLAEEAAYLRLLMYAWQQEKIGYLPNNETSLRRYTRMTTEQWAESRDIILKKFPVAEDSTLRFNARLLLEVEKQSRYRERSSEGGKKSAEKRWGKKEPIVSPLPENVSTLTKNDKPLTNSGNQTVTLHLQSPITTSTVQKQVVSTTGDASASDTPKSEIRVAVEACKSIPELTVLWQANPTRHEETGFKHLFTTHRKFLEAQPKTQPKARPSKAVARGCEALVDPNPDESVSFEAFWKLYLPFQGADKFDAKKIWVKLPGELRKRILLGLPAWIARETATKPEMQYHRHAPKFLNGSAWEDEGYGTAVPLKVTHRNVGGAAPTETYVPSYEQKFRDQAQKQYR